MLTARQQHCLGGIGISAWQLRPSTQEEIDGRGSGQTTETRIVESTPALPTPPPLKPLHQSFDLSDWHQTLQAIEACRNCELAKSCTRKVPGKGLQQADLMIIGEAPGHDEDLQGLPFVGRAGLLLDKMLRSINLDLESVYITNILKCRPPNNRDPKTEEIRACSPFLQAQIRLVQPKVLLSVGRISAQNLLKDQSPLGRLRGTKHTLPESNIPLLVTYHPAYLLRNPAEKAKAWEDLKALQKLLKHASH